VSSITKKSIAHTLNGMLSLFNFELKKTFRLAFMIFTAVAVVGGSTALVMYLKSDDAYFDSVLMICHIMLNYVVIMLVSFVAAMSISDIGTVVAVGVYTLPLKRWKILLTKILNLVFVAVVVRSFAFLASSAVIAVAYNNELETFTIQQFGNEALQAVLNCFVLVFFVLFVVLIGLATKNGAVGVIFPVVFYLAGFIMLGAVEPKPLWLNLLPFVNFHFLYYFIEGGDIMFSSYMTPLYSFLIILGYIILLAAASFLINSRQNIRG